MSNIFSNNIFKPVIEKTCLAKPMPNDLKSRRSFNYLKFITIFKNQFYLYKERRAGVNTI
jgi:hypothetical protein